MKHKNWLAICTISDTHMMWALALLDTSSELGQMITERLPEYFCDEEQKGPYPLSLMQELAQQRSPYSAENHARFHMVTFGAVPDWMPTVTFRLTGSYQGKPDLPHEIKGAIQTGDLIQWDGKRYFVLENNGTEVTMTLAEHVFIDC